MNNEKISQNPSMSREAYLKQQKKLRKIEKKRNKAAAWKIWAIVLLSMADVAMLVIVLVSALIRFFVL